MAERAERLLTLALALACMLAAAATVLPRTVARRIPIEIESPEITVAVDGAVHAPGLYTLPHRSLVADALALAGGLSDGAEPSLVDLAGVLGPGERVYVPTRATLSGGERTSLNSASVEQLQELPGVGPVTAARIVAGRPYGSLEELLRVKGIGEKTLERLRPLLRL